MVPERDEKNNSGFYTECVTAVLAIPGCLRLFFASRSCNCFCIELHEPGLVKIKVFVTHVNESEDSCACNFTVKKLIISTVYRDIF